MSYRQLEESINKWTIELEEQEKIFLNQATQVNKAVNYSLGAKFVHHYIMFELIIHFKTYPITYQVNSWDRMIFENGESIVNLNEDVEKVKADQTVSNKPQEPT